MATKKQRRRRAKERRHEWEYVLVDEEGREIAVEDANGKKRERAPSRTAGGRQAPVRAPGGRVIEPPSWERVLKRAAIFGPLILVVVYLLRPKGATLASVVVQAVILLAFFIPFSYLMDALMYRLARKRVARSVEGKGR
ncbi:MAG: hypothetical protein C4306_06455 [Thermoleophilia bacterium]